MALEELASALGEAASLRTVTLPEVQLFHPWWGDSVLSIHFILHPGSTEPSHLSAPQETAMQVTANADSTQFVSCWKGRWKNELWRVRNTENFWSKLHSVAPIYTLGPCTPGEIWHHLCIGTDAYSGVLWVIFSLGWGERPAERLPRQ